MSSSELFYLIRGLISINKALLALTTEIRMHRPQGLVAVPKMDQGIQAAYKMLEGLEKVFPTSDAEKGKQ